MKPSSAKPISNGELDPCVPDFALNLTLGPRSMERLQDLCR